MKIGHLFAHASGPRLGDCCFLGYRYDEAIGFVWDQLESWVLQRTATGVRPLISQRGWLTDLWRSPSGTVYVAGPGMMHRLTPDGAIDSGWHHQEEPLDGALAGVWGLNDQLVFTWGEIGNKPVMHLWEGKSWRAIPSPGLVNGVHGVSPELIYAVGAGGLLALWNGNDWTHRPSATDRMLSRVHVVGPDEIYAVGDGCLFRGTLHGWSEVLRAEGQLYDVAKHREGVWVAAGSDGLFTLQGDRLELFSAKITPERFDVREEMIIAARNYVLQFAPERTFLTTALQTFITMTENDPPRWIEEPAGTPKPSKSEGHPPKDHVSGAELAAKLAHEFVDSFTTSHGHFASQLGQIEDCDAAPLIAQLAYADVKDPTKVIIVLTLDPMFDHQTFHPVVKGVIAQIEAALAKWWAETPEARDFKYELDIS